MGHEVGLCSGWQFFCSWLCSQASVISWLVIWCLVSLGWAQLGSFSLLHSLPWAWSHDEDRRASHKVTKISQIGQRKLKSQPRCTELEINFTYGWEEVEDHIKEGVDREEWNTWPFLQSTRQGEMADVRAGIRRFGDVYVCLYMQGLAFWGAELVSGVKRGKIKNNSKVMIADDLEYSGTI